MARAAVTKVTIRKEGGFTKESVKEAYDKIGNVIDRASAEELKTGPFTEAGQVLKDALLEAAPRGKGEQRKGDTIPRLVTGIFLAKLTKATKAYVLVGVKFSRTPQGYWLEYGTSKMPAHPWFRRTMLRVRPQMGQIIADGLKRIIASDA